MRADTALCVIYTTVAATAAGSMRALVGPLRFGACTFSHPLAGLRHSAEPIGGGVRPITWLGR